MCMSTEDSVQNKPIFAYYSTEDRVQNRASVVYNSAEDRVYSRPIFVLPFLQCSDAMTRGMLCHNILLNLGLVCLLYVCAFGMASSPPCMMLTI